MCQKSSKLLKYAINYLSKFSSSKKNLKLILKKKIGRLKIEKRDKYDLYNSIENIIEYLEKNNFIDDNIYASSKITTFFRQGKSKIFIKSYFQQKGIDKDITNQSFEKFEQENPNWEYESAKIFVRKKRLSNHIDKREKDLSKLARAGFNYEISRKILEEN